MKKLHLYIAVAILWGIFSLWICLRDEQYLAAVFSKIASTETVGGEVVNYANSYYSFLELFNLMLYMGLGFGILLLIASPFLKKLMHGVR